MTEATSSRRALPALACLLAAAAGSGQPAPPGTGGQDAGTSRGVTPPAAVRVAHAAPEPVTLRVVKYPELCRAVKAERGKVVVLDIWGEY
jgi:hypothetical protein